jgi:Cu(I)/Ag(I) efflux system membrane protein CusA/SilA
MIITVSFLPVLTLLGEEGRLFAPLAYTKTYAIAGGALLAVTVTPILMGYAIRGRIAREHSNPLNRLLHALYRPSLALALKWPKLTVLTALVASSTVIWPLTQIGSEFMPPLNEGDLLYMPTTLPGLSIGEAARILQITDRAIRQMPEVETVFGKAGAAETATDPAPVSMIETTIKLKPRTIWPKALTMEKLIERLDQATRLPGLVNSWGYPIRTRISMLSTGVRTAIGVKITGPSLDGIGEIAEQVERVLRAVPGTRGVVAERATSGRYLDIDVDRFQAARFGISVADVQRLVTAVTGGETIGTVINGRQRIPIVIAYPRDFRESEAALAANRITTSTGSQVPLSAIAHIRFADGPAEIKSENGRLASHVYVDINTSDLGGYVAAAKVAVNQQIRLRPGYTIEWTGQYQNLMRAKARVLWIVPMTILVVLCLLQAHFRSMTKVAIVALCMPFALTGGFWLTYILGFNLSVAVAIGFISLAGVAAEFGIVMILYIDAALAAVGHLDAESAQRAIIEGALMRVRPKMMTVTVILAGLLPVMFSSEAGSDVMQRIAAPLIGGMFTAPLLSLFVVPALYILWMKHQLSDQQR